MRFISDRSIESAAGALLADYCRAMDTGEEIPVPVEAIAVDYLGLAIVPTSLAPGVIAELRVSEDQILLDEKSNQNPNRWRFSLAHEIGHYQLHSGLGSQSLCREADREVSRLEIQANTFAGSLLMPWGALFEVLSDLLGLPPRFARNVAVVDAAAALRTIRALRSPSIFMNALPKLAGRFGVSREALHIRLTSIGRLAGE
jgi:Zn-dependent peptidase ImmA (M78 family)